MSDDVILENRGKPEKQIKTFLFVISICLFISVFLVFPCFSKAGLTLIVSTQLLGGSAVGVAHDVQAVCGLADALALQVER